MGPATVLFLAEILRNVTLAWDHEAPDLVEYYMLHMTSAAHGETHSELFYHSPAHIQADFHENVFTVQACDEEGCTEHSDPATLPNGCL